jgi:hypothetical protein
MKNLIVIASLFALVVPAAFAASPTGQVPKVATPSASTLCKQQRRTIGTSAFRALYAPAGSPKAAMSTCLGKQQQLTTTAAKNAAMECKAERAADEEAFNATYGSNKNAKNAYGKCVSMKAKEKVTAQQQATLNAAKTCKAEQKAQGAQAFANKYGTNKKKRNAFGKCVSAQVKTQGG